MYLLSSSVLGITAYISERLASMGGIYMHTFANALLHQAQLAEGSVQSDINVARMNNIMGNSICYSLSLLHAGAIVVT